MPPTHSHVDAQLIAERAAATALAQYEAKREGQLEEQVDKGIGRVLAKLGLNLDDPEEVRQFKADLKHLRSWRDIMDTARQWGIAGTVGAFISLIAAVALAGIAHLNITSLNIKP